MSRDEAENYVWEVHDTYFVQHPKATTYTKEALYEYLCILLPTEDERQELYQRLPPKGGSLSLADASLRVAQTGCSTLYEVPPYVGLVDRSRGYARTYVREPNVFYEGTDCFPQRPIRCQRAHNR